MACNWINISGSQLVSATPGYLSLVLLTSDGGGTAHIKIYDGENERGDLVADFKCGSGWSESFLSNHSLYCHKGIYVKSVANLQSALICYQSYKE